MAPVWLLVGAAVVAVLGAIHVCEMLTKEPA